MPTARPSVKVASVSQAGIISLVDQVLGDGLKTLKVPTPSNGSHPTPKDYVDSGLTSALATVGATISALAITVGTMGSTPTPNGANAAGLTITFQPADASNPGFVTQGTQTFGGPKTFAGAVTMGTTLRMAVSKEIFFNSPTNTFYLINDAGNSFKFVGMPVYNTAAANTAAYAMDTNARFYFNGVAGSIYMFSAGSVVQTSGGFTSGASVVATTSITAGTSVRVAQGQVYSFNGSSLSVTGSYDGTNIVFAGAPVSCTSGITAAGITNTGSSFFSSANYVAFATGGQASATLIGAVKVAYFTTVATTGDSGRLPDAVAKNEVVVFNQGVASMNLYPFSGDAIDTLGTNNPIAIAAGASRHFYCRSSALWLSR